MKDALGMEIKKDCLYGYSNRQNGIATVVIGTVRKLTAQGVTLDIIYRGKALYTSEIEESHSSMDRKWINVAGNSLFPVYNDIFWRKDK